MREKMMLYFNMDIEIERKMWEYICKDGKNRKSYNVKKLLEKAVTGIPITPVTQSIPEQQPSNEISTSKDDLDLDDIDDLFV